MTCISEAIIVSSLIFGLFAWSVTCLFAPKFEGVRLSAKQSEWAAKLWLFSPFWVSVVLVLAALLPSSLGTLFGASHNHAIETYHAFCLYNTHVSNNDVVLWGIGLYGFGAFTMILNNVFKYIKGAFSVRALVRSSVSSDLGRDVRVLEVDEAIAVTAGILKPTILLSRGLLDAISPDTCRIILAHERAHIARRDLLSSFFESLAAAMYPKCVRQHLVGRLSLAREISCDEIAARTEGRINVASALVQVTRLKMQQPAFSMSIAASSLEMRVLNLLDEPKSSTKFFFVLAAAFTALVALGVFPVHEFIERALMAFLH